MKWWHWVLLLTVGSGPMWLLLFAAYKMNQENKIRRSGRAGGGHG